MRNLLASLALLLASGCVDVSVYQATTVHVDGSRDADLAEAAPPDLGSTDFARLAPGRACELHVSSMPLLFHCCFANDCPTMDCAQPSGADVPKSASLSGACCDEIALDAGTTCCQFYSVEEDGGSVVYKNCGAGWRRD